MTQEEYYKKLDRLEEQMDAIRADYNRPTSWLKDPEFKKLVAEKAKIRKEYFK